MSNPYTVDLPNCLQTRRRRPAWVLVRNWRSLFGKPELGDEAVEQLSDLNIIAAAIPHGCMGLPQELINHIMDILHDDFEALKACSLTCKAMFVSVRPLIHRTAYLDPPIAESVLTQEERGKRPHQGRQEQQRPIGNSRAELRFMAYMDDRGGLLQYARELHIRTRDFGFTPDSLLPYLHKFQSLDRVHTLSILHYKAFTWGAHFRTYFFHFYPTLTTLALRYPFGRYRLLLQFALQFPNLENLCLEWPLRGQQGPTLPVVVDQPPPLRGHLRLVGDDAVTHCLAELTHELPNGLNFRSIELGDFFGDPGQDIFSMCANTLECVTIRPQFLFGTYQHPLPQLAAAESLANAPPQKTLYCVVSISQVSKFSAGLLSVEQFPSGLIAQQNHSLMRSRLSSHLCFASSSSS